MPETYRRQYDPETWRPLPVADLVRHFRDQHPKYFRQTDEEEDHTMRPRLETVRARRAALKTERHPDTLKAKLETGMLPFQKGQPYFHAPQSEKAKEQRAIITEHNETVAALALDLLRAIDEAEPEVRAAVAAAMLPPSPAVALAGRFDKPGLDSTELLLVNIQTELQLARYDRELRGARASDLLTRYREAVASGSVAEQAYIERGGARVAASTEDVGELTALQTLSREIAATQAGRVPQELREAEALLTEARAAVDRVQDLAHDPRMPAGV